MSTKTIRPFCNCGSHSWLFFSSFFFCCTNVTFSTARALHQFRICFGRKEETAACVRACRLVRANETARVCVYVSLRDGLRVCFSSNTTSFVIHRQAVERPALRGQRDPRFVRASFMYANSCIHQLGRVAEITRSASSIRKSEQQHSFLFFILFRKVFWCISVQRSLRRKKNKTTATPATTLLQRAGRSCADCGNKELSWPA
jgi:hypothetical protein